MCSLTAKNHQLCVGDFSSGVCQPNQGKHIQTHLWTHVLLSDALHCAAEWRSQALSKNRLTPLTWVRGHSIAQGTTCSFPLLQFLGWTLPRGHMDPSNTMPKPTQGMRKGVFLCLQTCSSHQVTSEHPWSPLTLLEAALFLASFLLPHPLLASLPQPYPCHLAASSWPVPTLFLWTYTSLLHR